MNHISDEYISSILSLPEVIEAKNKIDSLSTGKVYFTISNTDYIKDAIYSYFGLDISSVNSIPMRWIKGDTLPHVDVAPSSYENTYLIYLTDSSGELILGDESYPIHKGSGFKFREGTYHETKNTLDIPRLLIGPMNEFVEPVGGPVTFYYPTENDALALNETNLLAQYGSYTVTEVSGYTHWRLASNSEGPSSQTVVYYVGDVLIGDGIQKYYLSPTTPCFLENSKILCLIDGKEEYVPVEKLSKGMLVKTSLNGYKKVEVIGTGTIDNFDDDNRIENRLYRLSKEKYPELQEDLFVTGCHSILVHDITDKQRKETVKRLGNIFITEKKYRLMACVDERAEPWRSKGKFNIWHFALENEDTTKNYGVYSNGCLVVETCSIGFLKRSSLRKVS
jgi:hypothetical protein